MLWSGMRLGTKRALRRTLERSGFEIRRVAVRKDSPGLYYRASPTCQIPELAWLFELYFGRRSDGYFVEVGAFDGEKFSNSSCLADRGWSGLLIEPVPAFAQQCRTRHATNHGVKVIEVAVGDSECDATLHVARELTTSDPALLETYRRLDWAQESIRDVMEIRVRRRRLDDILTEQQVKPGFDLLIVDVEGGEEAVFEGFDLDLWRPTMLIVELSDTHPNLQATSASDRRMALVIADHGYCVVYRDMINTVFLRRDIYAAASTPLDEGSSSIR